ncbi:putative pumilio-family rna binding repeat protein [Phaeoacremonium minimum UCRPA7]|uniref:Putative pumilio-family rna binding repeat protein n=1 Tax=Phaeoacremonium minimum (strain UCR-PA7) TaxID=1286976 RepID=R8BXY1_PHAM7|nr:putative pumilio-family rna binding repeat protein [Phaeoacremonium minimum UCRPA7]EOO04256.1 putative pumilio-family rna binding repeat protein [Phaeoacremonium minimum UCRPA7]
MAAALTQDENLKRPEEAGNQHQQDGSPSTSLKKGITALSTSKLANQSMPKKLKVFHEPIAIRDSHPVSKLLARLPEKQSGTMPRNENMKSDDESLSVPVLDHGSASSSLPITPTTEGFTTIPPTARSASATPNEGHPTTEEVLRLKLELAQAQNKITRLDQELAQTRDIQFGSRRPTPTTSPEQNISLVPNVEQITARAPGAPVTNVQPRAAFPRDNFWHAPVPDDCRSETSDALSATGFNRSRAIWNSGKPSFQNAFVPNSNVVPDAPQPVPWGGLRNPDFMDHNPHFPPPVVDGFRSDRVSPEQDFMMRPSSARRGNRYDHRFGQPQPFAGHKHWPLSTCERVYFYRVIFLEERSDRIDFYKAIATEGQTYLPTTEPLNYRRLLDRNVNCNWKYIVDKIVCNNDQQASIFLQQKLKVGTPEQKYEIVEAIVAQAYPLMVNRFGNFLVQRCFEHGTPEQVIKIAEAIRGNTLSLSMDSFGCHVVQKAFDSVPEDYKAIMVHELLRRIPETVIHRYACHVWQKLFELRWTKTPPQIMKFVNEALRGMWHEVALGETGSLVVQNIFENCLEEDKRPCIEEVLANIDIVAHGQFGNWCIQHICEHGAPADRSRAIDHVVRYAAEYSMDQFASKVVEKCLKIGGPEFLGRYLDRVCEGRVDRPRIPLIDIASDQYGNYLIQHILMNANPQHKEIVAAHIRKHMVSLRGSKFGSRVGMLCTNPAVATRPGPGLGPVMGNRMAPGPRYGGAYR